MSIEDLKEIILQADAVGLGSAWVEVLEYHAPLAGDCPWILDETCHTCGGSWPCDVVVQVESIFDGA